MSTKHLIALIMLLLAAGCNTVPQALNGLGKDAQIAGAALQAATAKHSRVNVPTILEVPGAAELDSMTLDKERW